MACHQWCECHKCTTHYDACFNEIPNPHTGQFHNKRTSKTSEKKELMAMGFVPDDVLKNVSEWTIFIDDVQGELAMYRDEDQRGGRMIDVVAKEEVLPVIKGLQDEIDRLKFIIDKGLGPNDLKQDV